MLRVIREVKPTWVIGENVRGLLSIDNGMVFEDCCASLEALGYEVQPFVIPACAVNAPHRRDRVWIVAHSNVPRERTGLGEIPQAHGEISQRDNDAQSEQSDCHAPDTESRRPERQITGRESERETTRRGRSNNGSGKIFTDTGNDGLQGGERAGSHEQRQAAHGSITERNSAWDEPWYSVALRTCVRNLDDGVSGRLAGRGRVNKLKALGNAIVPQVAYQILLAIIQAEEETI
jgi:DNA (cytosine-5)-methyltransferase 1